MTKLDKVKAKVEQFVRNQLTDSAVEVKVYLWGGTKFGPRVAELDFWKPNGQGGGAGNSFMQVDLPHGLAVCAAAERLMIAYYEGWPADEVQDEEWRLTEALGLDHKEG